jgi:hypothetical protein
MRDIDAIANALIQAHPGLRVTQLRVPHPGADDDGLWFFKHPSSQVEVQLESSTGNCPFLMESDANSERLAASTAQEAVALVASALGLGPQPNKSFKPNPLRGSA